MFTFGTIIYFGSVLTFARSFLIDTNATLKSLTALTSTEFDQLLDLIVKEKKSRYQLEHFIGMLESRCNDLEESVYNLTMENTALRESVHNLTEENTTLRALGESINNITVGNIALRESVNNITQENLALRKSVYDLRQENLALHKYLNNLTAEHLALRAKNTDLENRIEFTRNQSLQESQLLNRNITILKNDLEKSWMEQIDVTRNQSLQRMELLDGNITLLNKFVYSTNGTVTSSISKLDELEQLVHNQSLQIANLNLKNSTTDRTVQGFLSKILDVTPSYIEEASMPKLDQVKQQIYNQSQQISTFNLTSFNSTASKITQNAAKLHELEQLIRNQSIQISTFDLDSVNETVEYIKQTTVTLRGLAQQVYNESLHIASLDLTGMNKTIQDMKKNMGLSEGFTATSPRAVGRRGLSFRTVLYNPARSFSTSTGRFTCRYPGLYLFTATMTRMPGATQTFCYIFINSQRTVEALANDEDPSTYAYPSGTAVLVVHLKAGDHVYLSECDGLYKIY